MRNKFFPAAGLSMVIALLLPQACSELENPSLVHYPPIVSSPDTPSSGQDTSIYVCGVSFPEDYDWHRDTARGAVNATVKLWLNGRTVADIPTGKLASAEDDTHHIIDGKLYTESCSDGMTRIAENGELVLEYEGSEWLSGLLRLNESIYTLGMRRNGKGFTLRRDGVIQLTKDQGTPFGGFRNGYFPQTGALYEDRGHTCFGYWYDDSLNVQCFMVEDGKETRLKDQPAKTMKEIRMVDGVAEYYESSDTDSEFSLLSDSSEAVRISIPAGWYFPNVRCAAVVGGKTFLALSPRDGGYPVLMKGTAKSEYGINGFLSGIQVIANQQ